MSPDAWHGETVPAQDPAEADKLEKAAVWDLQMLERIGTELPD